jgi:hypothetical protein
MPVPGSYPRSQREGKEENEEEEAAAPAQDLMVWILRSSTTTLRRWVMSPARRNRFIFDNPFSFLSLPLRLIKQSPFFLSRGRGGAARRRVVAVAGVGTRLVSS